MIDWIPPLPGHAVYLLFLQLALLLVLARILAEVMRRVGQPAVIGELLAGLLLGPTLLGHFAPNVFDTLFPPDVAQFHLLEAVSWIGMVLLLLLTGLETNLRDMRSLGRTALLASIFGMLVPFASGLGLGWVLPDQFLVDPADRPIFAAFLATAMAISAMPVIAKILMDLNLLKRNIGMVTLSAAVVDDTVGWFILSIIAGVAAGGAFSSLAVGITVVQLGLFVAGLRWIAYPFMVRALGYVNERVGLVGADLTLILAFTFLCAAVTEGIGIHAVFGAFAAGLLIRQIPRLKSSTIQNLEAFVLAGFSPIFFAFVGLKVNLWTLSGWGLPLLVIGIAIFGKLAGCYLGGRLGRLSPWESLALGFGMNARGAMELIVAMIGLSLGLLTQEMYSTIVLVAVVTSFMAPLLLRWVAPRLVLGEDERRRIEDSAQQYLLPSGTLRALVPTAGGSNAMAAFGLASVLARGTGANVTALFVDQAPQRKGLRRLGWGRAQRGLAGKGLEEHLDRAAGLISKGPGSFRRRRVSGGDVGDAIVKEAAFDYDLLFLGAAPEKALHDPFAQRIVSDSPITVVIVRDGRDGDEPPATTPRGILVPIDGSLFTRYAAEFAFAYAAAGNQPVTLLHVLNPVRFMSGSMPMPERTESGEVTQRQRRDVETRLREGMGPLAAHHGATFTVRVLSRGAPAETIIHESQASHYQLLVLGAENKSLLQPLFFGQGTAEVVERAGCTTAVVVPRLDTGDATL